jgi:prepilin-type N-terminal cleavage/methylation domain-containing protein
MSGKNRYESGVTLIELVITLVVIGVLSAVAVANIDARAKHSVTVQADEFRRALSHLQLMAISQGNRLKLTVTSSGYSVCSAVTTPCNAAGAMTDSATGSAFSVALSDGVSFVSGIGDYYFDNLGRPATAATGAGLVTATSSFGLNGVGRATAVTVTVLPITGFAQTAY